MPDDTDRDRLSRGEGDEENRPEGAGEERVRISRLVPQPPGQRATTPPAGSPAPSVEPPGATRPIPLPPSSADPPAAEPAAGEVPPPPPAAAATLPWERPAETPAEPEPPPEPPEAAEELEPAAAPAEPAGFTEVAEAARGVRADRDGDDLERYRSVVRAVEGYVENGYQLLGLVGYPASGKTHSLKALTYLLEDQGFNVSAREEFRKVRVPGQSEALVFHYPCTRGDDEKWVFTDAGGELYARLRSNDWSSPERSAALLHSLHHCQGLFMLLHLQPGHLNRGTLGFDKRMSESEKLADAEAQRAQEELEFLDGFLLFLRALKHEAGNVHEVMRRCAEATSLDEALRDYRTRAPLLDIPVMVLFTQADTLADSPYALGPGRYLSPRKGIVGVAPFVAHHLPFLFSSLLEQARHFKFDFIQSYEEYPAAGWAERGAEAMTARWEYDGELLSVGLLAGLELVERHLPEGGDPLRRFALDTRRALRLHRRLHPKLWRGAKVGL